jgi:hypothetical protein
MNGKKTRKKNRKATQARRALHPSGIGYPIRLLSEIDAS